MTDTRRADASKARALLVWEDGSGNLERPLPVR